MAAQNPQDVAKRWSQGLAGAGQKIRDGVTSTTTPPGQAAARQKAVYLANVQQSADKWAQRVGSVTLADWQNAMLTKGVDRIATGATQAEGKMANFLTRFLPYVESGRAALPPRGTFDQNLARSAAMIRHLHAYKG